MLEEIQRKAVDTATRRYMAAGTVLTAEDNGVLAVWIPSRMLRSFRKYASFPYLFRPGPLLNFRVVRCLEGSFRTRGTCGRSYLQFVSGTSAFLALESWVPYPSPLGNPSPLLSRFARLSPLRCPSGVSFSLVD